MRSSVVDYENVSRQLLRRESLSMDGVGPLAALLRSAMPRRLKGGTILVKEGELADELLVVARGSVRVLLQNERGLPTEVALLKAPCLLGPIAIIDDGRRSATCVLASSGLVLALERDRVEAVFTGTNRRAEVMRELMLAGMFRKLDQATARLRTFLHEGPARPVDPYDEDQA